MNEDRMKQSAVAIIGIGCRFPGGIKDPETFWSLLTEGRDGITNVPPDRWDIDTYYDPDRSKTGKVYVCKGGFLDEISKFDPLFFGISPREAAYMDPQQRLLLEVSWEALEDGGINPQQLAGSAVGVFMGMFTHEFEQLHVQSSELHLLGPHSGTGIGISICSNRISYCYNFKGPSISVDTACSSSLVAAHLACQSLLNDEVEVALAGGVNVMIDPRMTVVLCKGSFLSPDGYCKSFDDSADGYARAEGTGVVVLKRLDKALADGDPIYAVIRGSALNQDGKTKGLTVPSLSSQILVIKTALEKAGMQGREIQYVEAHGTGTAVGDPIEAAALSRALTEGRSAGQECIVGSVKSNFGHTESAAGVAGLIKAALMLRHGQIPPNLHFNTPNRQIPFDEYKLRIPTSLEAWPTVGENGRRTACVNSFGFGGTNAHAVLESWEPSRLSAASGVPPAISTTPEGQLHLAPFSAHTAEALRSLARSIVEYTGKVWPQDGATLYDIGYNASLRRAHHEHRLIVAVNSTAELADKMTAFIAGESRPGMTTGRLLNEGASRVAFVFSGMGQQWRGMGKRLYQSEPVFRQMFDNCAEAFRKLTRKWDLAGELFEENETRSRLGETQVVQPMIFSLQAGLDALWRSWGVVPDAVIGHSIGEVAAAHSAGILSLEDAVLVTFHRGRLLQRLEGRGKMLAVGVSTEELRPLLEGLDDGRITVAAINGPRSLTLSGDETALREIARRLEEKNEFARFVNVNIPYHSAALDTILDEFEKAIAGIHPQTRKVEMASTVTGKPLDGLEAGVSYWRDNIRKTVLFADGIGTLIDSGCSLFVEVSAHPVLSVATKECLDSCTDRETLVIPCLRRDGNDRLLIYGALGQLYAAGGSMDWRRLYRSPGKFVRFPTYPWQNESFWLESEESMRRRRGGKTVTSGADHPLLGKKLDFSTHAWGGYINKSSSTHLADHVVQGCVVFPASAYLEMALAAGKKLFGNDPFAVRDVVIQSPLLLQDDKNVSLGLVVENDFSFRIHSKSVEGNQEWNLHVRGRLERIKGHEPLKHVDIEERKKGLDYYKTKRECYEDCRRRGLEYGPRFQVLEELWYGGNAAMGRLQLHAGLEKELGDYLSHPTLLDGCFQVFGQINTPAGTFLPVNIDSIIFNGSPEAAAWCHSLITHTSRNRQRGDVLVLDRDGSPLLEVRGLHTQKMEGGDDFDPELLDGMLYEPAWILDNISARAVRRSGSGYLPAPEHLAKILDPFVPEVMTQLGMDNSYCGISEQLDRLCGLYAAESFGRLSLEFGSGDPFEAEALFDKLGMLPERRAVANMLFEIMARDGILRSEDGKWRVLAVPEKGRAERFWRELFFRHPEWLAELNLLQQCGRRLDSLLFGKEVVGPIDFYPDSLLAEFLFQDSPSFRSYNRLIQMAVATIIESLPPGQSLRVLELGEQAGALARTVFPALPQGQVEYIVTADSDSLLNKASARLREKSAFVFKLIDLERDLAEQGFEPGSFDLVLAGHLPGAIIGPAALLKVIGNLLTPDGLLIRLDAPSPPAWFSLILGLGQTGACSGVESAVSGTQGLGQTADIAMLLESAGFSGFVRLPKNTGAKESLQEILIARKNAAQAPGDPGLVEKQPLEQTRKQPPDRQPWIILADREGLAGKLSALLAEHGIEPVVVGPGGESEASGDGFLRAGRREVEDFSGIIRSVCPDNSVSPVVISLRGVCGGVNDASHDSPEAVSNTLCTETLHLVQALMLRDWPNPPPALWLVTAGVEVICPSDEIRLAPSSLRGMVHVIQAEFPLLRTRCIDLSAAPSEDETRLLLEELLAPGNEDETALRGGLVYRRRIVERKERDLFGAPAGNFTLHAIKSRGLSGLSLTDSPNLQPGPGEVEVEVRAAGLNFKDVLMAGGILDNANILEWKVRGNIGWEFSGVVRQTGEGVEKYRPGDEVIGMGYNSFSRRTIVSDKVLVHKPRGIGFEAAAGIPVVFFTAYYALYHLARVGRGDRVLIHSASGGLGIAAIQIARAAGAEVFVTAGTPEKRMFLESLGVEYVGDSRSLAFADDILARTGGEGIDIILNTLPVNAMSANISVLKPVTGHLIDLSNVYEQSMRLHTVSRGYSFHSFVLDNFLILYPDSFQRVFAELLEHLESGDYHPAPCRTYPLYALAEAFKYMRTGKHIGKVVVSMQGPATEPLPTRDKIDLDENATYLITGGLGGFGLSTARWLVDCGARHLALLGRSGASRPEARKVVDDLVQAGVEVLVEPVDVTRPEEVTALIERIGNGGHPLRGIIHAAMVLEDRPFMHMNAADMKRAMDPKVLGAWNLHSGALNCKLDFFICFSSLASVIGNQSQANYAAANSFLDSFMHYRRRLGLHGLSINWGSIGWTGYLERNSELKDFLQRRGLGPVSLHQAFRTIAYALEKDLTQIVAAPINWKKLSGYLTAVKYSPRFSLLLNQNDQSENGSGSKLISDILSAAPGLRREMLAEFLAGETARILGLAKGSLDRKKPLDSLGIDSLMAVELLVAIESGLGLVLSKMLLSRPGLTIGGLAETIESEMIKQSGDAKSSQPPAAGAPGEDKAEMPLDVDKLSDRDVDMILNSMLTGKGRRDG